MDWTDYKKCTSIAGRDIQKTDGHNNVRPFKKKIVIDKAINTNNARRRQMKYEKKIKNQEETKIIKLEENNTRKKNY